MSRRKRPEPLELDTVAAHILHDLSTPVAAAAMRGHLLLDQARDHGGLPLRSAIEPLTELVASVERIAELVETFRHVTRNRRPQLRAVDLANLLDEIERAWRVTARAHRVDLGCVVGDGVPPIQADALQLRRMLDNLIENAVAAVAPTHGRVTVVVSAVDADTVQLSVEDTGPGLPDDVDVFAPFETTKERGTGLGLSIVAQIVAAHGGDLMVEPLVPRGAAFRVELPVRRAPACSVA